MRVLVTRPQPGAARTAERIRRLGFTAIEMPLTQTVAMTDIGNVDLEGVAAVAITSANAIRLAPVELLKTLSGLPCCAVGRETADHARAAGFSDVHEGPGSAESLGAEMGRRVVPGSAILYLCGRVRLATFETQLAGAGFRVRVVETYDTLPVVYPPAALSERLGAEPIDVVLLYSAGAAGHFSTLAESVPGFGRPRLLCLSPRVAQRLAGAEPSRISVAAEPTEDALLALL